MKTKEFVASLIEAARAHILRGFFVVPIPSGKNHPTLQNWQKLRLRTKEVKVAFSNAGGIALLLKPSKLTDVDLDCPEAVAAGRVLLPSTDMIQGRRGKRSYLPRAQQGLARADEDPKAQASEARNYRQLGDGAEQVAPSSHWRFAPRKREERHPQDAGLQV
jgi:Bifunctional DNA primase/polymerase, N-terminal